jgi:very-short-patch-repair endonuclease
MNDNERKQQPTTISAKLAEETLSELSREQFATFSRRQALDCGFSRHQIVTRLSSGMWTVVHPKVYRISAAPVTKASMAIAGRLYAGGQAWFSHATAARLLGIDPYIPADRTWVTVPAPVQRQRRPGLIIVRSRRIDGFTDSAYGQPVLDARRTVIDLAAILDDQMFRRVLYDVFSRDLMTVDDVLIAAEDFGGRTGLALVHRAIEGFDPAFESGAEYEADALFSGAGLIFERQVEIREDGILLARLDFADEERRLGVEIDGARFHSTPSARFYDRERDKALARKGWHIERLSTDDVRRRPNATIRHLRAVYAQRDEAHRGA